MAKIDCPACGAKLETKGSKAIEIKNGFVTVSELMKLHDANDLVNLHREKKLSHSFDDLSKITDKWGFIRQAYMERISNILEASQDCLYQSADPYIFDWNHHLSPIEKIAWSSIRDQAIPLYPQFPLFNYFIDFANPYMRVGIEMDGKKWHDHEKDSIRDQTLAEYGWKIFRIKGSEAYVKFNTTNEVMEKRVIDFEDDNPSYEALQEVEAETVHWLTNTADGVIESIKRVYFPRSRQDHEDRFDICIESLESHRIAVFSVFDARTKSTVEAHLKKIESYERNAY